MKTVRIDPEVNAACIFEPHDYLRKGCIRHFSRSVTLSDSLLLTVK